MSGTLKDMGGSSLNMGRPKRAERRESRQATKRLRRFRAKELPRFRSDCLRFTLSEAVAMASIRREAQAVIGLDRTGGRLHMERGMLRSVEADGWTFTVEDDSVQARKL